MLEKRQLRILDCTLRDGGLGLEDAFLNEISNKSFKSDTRKEILELLISSKVDMIEIGSIEESIEDKRKFCIYENVELASKILDKTKSEDQNFAVMYRGPDIPIEKIPEWKEGFCKYARVIIRYTELKKSLEFCENLTKKGYSVFIQPMVTMRYTDAELQLLIDYANKINAFALYIVDSYGYMQIDDLRNLFFRFDKYLNDDILIGFHGHNNTNLAFSNVLGLLNFETKRDIVIDSTLLGMGQGAGNLQTELFTTYLKEKYDFEYKNNAILDACEIIEKFTESNLWGYSITNMLPAIYKIAYKYSINYRNYFGLSYSDIDKVLSNMPREYIHRYTFENAKKILDNLGIKYSLDN